MTRERVGRWEPKLIATLPAAPGQLVQIIAVSALYDHRPTKDDVYTEVQPVIGWAIYRNGEEAPWPEPILIETVASDSIAWHVLPDGKLMLLEDMTADNLAQAKAETLGRAQELWDDKHPARSEG